VGSGAGEPGDAVAALAEGLAEGLDGALAAVVADAPGLGDVAAGAHPPSSASTAMVAATVLFM